MLKPLSSYRLWSSTDTTTTQNKSQNVALNSAEALLRAPVSLSEEARDRLRATVEATATLDALNRNNAESQKELARARIEEIKRRIDALKSLVMMLGPEAAKGLMRELKQLAGQLKQAAGVLNSSGASPVAATGNLAQAMSSALGGDNGAADATAAANAATALADSAHADAAGATAAATAPVATPPAGVHSTAGAATDSEANTEAQDADASDNTADTAATAEDAAATTLANQAQQAVQAAQERQQHRQAQADAQNLQQTARALAGLVAMVKSKLQAAQRNDPETQRDLRAIQRDLQGTEDDAQQLRQSGLGVAGDFIAGDFAVSATAGIDSTGSATTAAPVSVTVSSPPTA